MKADPSKSIVARTPDPYRQAFADALEGMALIDAGGVFLDANPAFLHLLGYAREEISALPTLHLLVPEPARHTWRKTILEPALDPTCGAGEGNTSFKHKQSHLVHVRLRLRAHRTEDGRLAHVWVSALDRSELLALETALDQSVSRLREAERMTRIGYWYWDLNTGDVTWTDGVFRIFGFEPHEFTPHIDSIMERSPWPEHRERHIEIVNRSMELREPGEYEQKFLRKDGSIGYYFSSFEGVYDDNGHLVAMKGTVQDISDRKAAEQEREALSVQLSQTQRLESMGRLAGGVAHDFNNMLNVILGNLALALDDLPEADPIRLTLEEAEKAAERSTDLTRQLLAFARRQTAAPRVLHLNESINATLKLLRRLIGENIHLTWKPGLDLATVRIDPAQLDQTLTNLVVNARHAVGHEAGRITIETSSASIDEVHCIDNPEFLPGDYVVLSISDNGCGMNDETKARVFEPFFTTRSQGEGTGLGLATVYGIVKQNRGFISVYSEPDQGTTFRIYLPAHDAPADHEPSPEELCNRPVGGSETLLLVEDEPAILDLGCRSLERLGYRVLAAGAPDEALRIAREYNRSIDLLVTDVIMPVMNGRELATALCAIRPDLKLLFMSGYTADVIADHGVLEDGVNFIEKPFSIASLSRKIREVLDSR